MAKIDQLMDEHGGRGESKESGVSTEKELFNAIKVDLAGITTATIASADATDLAEALTLVNEIKASLNATSSFVKTLT